MSVLDHSRQVAIGRYMNPFPQVKMSASEAAALGRVSQEIRQDLDLETLEDRRRDSLDFHEVSVASLRDVIRKAFEAGLAAGKAK